jgi:hypothetical protein
MSSTSPCWACQSVDISETATCRVCSPPSSSQKSHLPKPWNTRRPRALCSFALDTVRRLHQLHNSDEVAIKNDIAALAEMNTPALIPDRELPSLMLLPRKYPWIRPSITLTGPENDYPTMDLDTFNELVRGRRVRDLGILRIAPAHKAKLKKHPKGDKCQMCINAAVASAYFAEGMKKEVVSHGQWYMRLNCTKAMMASESLAEGPTIKDAVEPRDKDKYTGSTSRYRGSEGSWDIEAWMDKVIAELAIAEKASPRCKAYQCTAGKVPRRCRRIKVQLGRNETSLLKAKHLEGQNVDPLVAHYRRRLEAIRPG